MCYSRACASCKGGVIVKAVIPAKEVYEVHENSTNTVIPAKGVVRGT